MSTATRKPAKVQPPATPKAPEPVKATLILGIFRGRSESAEGQLAKRRAELAQAILDGWNLASVLDGSEKIVEVEAESVCRTRAFKVINGDTDDTYGHGIRDRLAFLIEQADHETAWMIGSQAWNQRSTNAVSNALEAARVNTLLRTWLEVAKTCRSFLAGEIAEDIEGAAR